VAYTKLRHLFARRLFFSLCHAEKTTIHHEKMHALGGFEKKKFQTFPWAGFGWFRTALRVWMFNQEEHLALSSAGIVCRNMWEKWMLKAGKFTREWRKREWLCSLNVIHSPARCCRYS
jgi:hypothetical protein